MTTAPHRSHTSLAISSPLAMRSHCTPAVHASVLGPASDGLCSSGLTPLGFADDVRHKMSMVLPSHLTPFQPAAIVHALPACKQPCALLPTQLAAAVLDTRRTQALHGSGSALWVEGRQIDCAACGDPHANPGPHSCAETLPSPAEGANRYEVCCRQNIST